MLEYRVVPDITNDSLSKRTMRVENAKFPIIFGPAKGDGARKDSHTPRSTMTVFLGVLDFTNGEGEGGSSIDG